MTPLVVIGCGNELRGDDAVGPCVSRQVARWNRPSVRGLAVHQLTPELISEFETTERIVFVDAACAADRVGWQAVKREAAFPVLGHVATPGGLVTLADAICVRIPRTWRVTVPAREFGFGRRLSPVALRGARTVLRQLAAVIRSVSRCQIVDRA